MLEVQEPLVARSWLTGRLSAAVLVRKVDADRPTLLLDESDAAFKGDKEYAEALRGILNTGYRRSGKASLCVGPGANIRCQDFSTFGAKAIAGIGELPDTIADRAIRIELKRRTSDETCARWRERDGRAQAAPIHETLVAWATQRDVIEWLRAARPTLVAGLSDRQADVWEPLFAIADLAGGEWPERARRAAIALTGIIDDTDDINIKLLADIRNVFENESFISSRALAAALAALDESPWASFGKSEKAITPHAIARLLKKFRIVPVHTDAGNGYRRAAFEDAWTRYLGSEPSDPQKPNKARPDPSVSNVQSNSGAEGLNVQKSSMNPGLPEGLKVRKPDQAEKHEDAGLF